MVDQREYMTYDSKEELIKSFHAHRKLKKGEWLFFKGYLKDDLVQIKSYNNWIQILQFKGVRDSGPMDTSVKKVTEYLQSILSI